MRKTTSLIVLFMVAFSGASGGQFEDRKEDLIAAATDPYEPAGCDFETSLDQQPFDELNLLTGAVVVTIPRAGPSRRASAADLFVVTTSSLLTGTPGLLILKTLSPAAARSRKP